MTKARDDSSDATGVATVREQFELARGCAWFAVIISAAVLLSNFGPEPKDLVVAREQVAAHRAILREHETILRQNEVLLRENQAVLKSLRK